MGCRTTDREEISNLMGTSRAPLGALPIPSCGPPVISDRLAGRRLYGQGLIALFLVGESCGGLAEDRVDAVHVKLRGAVIIVDAVLLLLHVGELSIAIA